MTIKILIADYLNRVEDCLILFENKFGRRDLVRAWRENVIPPSGELTPGVKYKMHGVGCAVEYPNHDIDFDFATRDKVGFDAWRLWNFAEQFPDTYPHFQQLKAIEAALATLIEKREATQIVYEFAGEANDNLLTLTEQ